MGGWELLPFGEINLHGVLLNPSPWGWRLCPQGISFPWAFPLILASDLLEESSFSLKEKALGDAGG